MASSNSDNVIPPPPPVNSRLSSTTNEISGNLPNSSRVEMNSNPPSAPRQNIPTQVRITATIRTQSATTNPSQQPTNNNNGEFPQQGQNLFHMRDRLFLALFFRVSLIYARTFPKSLRRFIEFCLLMQSIILLFILGYIHMAYTQTPITCLSEYRNSWPKEGILRVEITTDTSTDYDISKSYEKEERLRQRAAASQMGQYGDDLLTMMLTADTFRQLSRVLLDRVVTTAGELISSVTSSGQEMKSTATDENSDGSIKSSPPTESVTESEMIDEPKQGSTDSSENSETSNSKNTSDNDIIQTDGVLAPGISENVESTKTELAADDASILPSFGHTASGEGSPILTIGIDGPDIDTADRDSVYFNKTLEEIEELKLLKQNSDEETILKSSVSDFEMFSNSVWLQDQAYIVEYALEYGFLRLSPETRKKLNIEVKIVTLDPSKQACFGDTFSRFLLDNFLGYDDILMASIKNLAESEENKGYLRNVVTGEQFRFVPMWMARSAYIPSLLIMLVFTVSISMLLRYSHHQIFVFIVDLLNNIEGAGAIHIPAAPLFTVILALVGMEAIMSEFFNDTSTAFYVILIVWIADQYDSVCSHTQITRTYWVRFFYLYHFAFYAYHYRFNGQYGSLALLVSWSFIQHSMVYFYHHYELPTILRQAHVGDDVTSRSPTPAPAAVTPVTTPTVSSEPEINVSNNPVQAEARRTEEATGVSNSSTTPTQSTINNGNTASRAEANSRNVTTLAASQQESLPSVRLCQLNNSGAGDSSTSIADQLGRHDKEQSFRPEKVQNTTPDSKTVRGTEGPSTSSPSTSRSPSSVPGLNPHPLSEPVSDWLPRLPLRFPANRLQAEEESDDEPD